MNKLSKDQLRDYIASEIKRINAWDDVPESQKAPRRVYVTSVQKFADGHFDELMASRTHICVPPRTSSINFRTCAAAGGTWELDF